MLMAEDIFLLVSGLLKKHMILICTKSIQKDEAVHQVQNEEDLHMENALPHHTVLTPK